MIKLDSREKSRIDQSNKTAISIERPTFIFRWIIIIGVFSIAMVSFYLVAFFEFAPFLDGLLKPSNEAAFWVLMLTVSFMTIITIGFFRYLNPSVTRVGASEEYNGEQFNVIGRVGLLERDLLNNTKQVESLRERVLATTGEIVDAEARRSLISEVRNKITEEATQEYLEELEAKILNDTKVFKYDEIFRGTKERIEAEISSLAKRSNINLYLGIICSTVGFFVLAYYIFPERQYTSVSDFLYYVLPRLSLVLFIEVFAYFFLRLYKQGLSDMKYFQDELTNIESKYMGVSLSVYESSDQSTEQSIQTLLKTERNVEIVSTSQQSGT